MTTTSIATRTAPSAYTVDAAHIDTGLVFKAHGQTFEVVGDPITVGYRMVNVRVREVGGRFDGNEFGAYLTPGR
jgi:hypothetical protein